MTLNSLRACRDSGAQVSPTLLDATIECLVRGANAEVLRKERDSLIRAAALLLPPGSDWIRARQLTAEAKLIRRSWRTLRNQSPRIVQGGIRDLLHAAALSSELPESHRQFYRVLHSGEN